MKALQHCRSVDLDLANGEVVLGPVVCDKAELEVPRPRRFDQVKGLRIIAGLGRVGAQIDPRRVGIRLRTEDLELLGMGGIALVVGQDELLDQYVLGEADDDVLALLVARSYGVLVVVTGEEVRRAVEVGRLFQDESAGGLAGVVYDDAVLGRVLGGGCWRLLV